MKKIITCILLLISSVNSFADCDFSKGITPLADGSFKYTKECHLFVGQLVQDNKTKDLQIADLTKAITLKDLALKEADSRVFLWQKSANDELDRLNAITNDSKRDRQIYKFYSRTTDIR